MQDTGYVVKFEDGRFYAHDGKSGLIGATIFRTELAASFVMEKSDEKYEVLEVKVELV